MALLALASATVAGTHEWVKYPSLGTVGGSCFLIEYWMRRMSGRANPFRIFLPIWSLIPFAIACVIGATQHLHTRDDAMLELRKLAGEL